MRQIVLSAYNKERNKKIVEKEKYFENFCLSHFSEETQKHWKNRNAKNIEYSYSLHWKNGISTATINVFFQNYHWYISSGTLAKETISFVSKEPYS